jgi:RNA polymerase sigma-70 factor (ECF subfamily)
MVGDPGVVAALTSLDARTRAFLTDQLGVEPYCGTSLALFDVKESFTVYSSKIGTWPTMTSSTAQTAEIEPPRHSTALATMRPDDRARRCEALVRRYGDRLYSTALRILRNDEDARDALQDAYLAAFRAMDSFQGRSGLYTWLYRITVNASLKRLRRRSHRGHASLDGLLPQFDDHGCRLESQWGKRPRDVETLAQSRQVRRFVRRAIEDLPESHRTVLLLRDIEELSSRETARILGISVGAVNVRLHRARAALKKLLEPFVNERCSSVPRSDKRPERPVSAGKARRRAWHAT